MPIEAENVEPVTRIGVDIGGTFTDLVLARSDGSFVFHKRLTTPHDLARGFTDGVRELVEKAGITRATVTDVFHATTLGSNVVIERRGASTALITTRGFRDLLEIQRCLRYSMYDVFIQKPTPLVPRSCIWEVTERTMADGSVRTALVEEDIVAIAGDLQRRGIRTVAVGFLHAYANPDHERRVRNILLREAPELLVTLSSDVSLQAREYERINTAVVNAYVAPVLRGYIVKTESEIRDWGIRGALWIMQSSGGLTSTQRAIDMPVFTIESGPAAGALMAARHGRLAGHEKVLALDMGGTTAKMAVIQGGRPRISRRFEIDRREMRDGSGLPIDIPAVDLVEIGAGGGSIASMFAGVLRVGPRSAGADPGPACYGRGGADPTVTDALLILGYLNPDYFAGGAIRLDRLAAEEALRRLGRALGLDPVETAWSIYELATFEMERAIRMISVDKGLDTRDFAMVCFGGAGPAHGCRLARVLEIGRVIFPVGAGVGSALGLVEAEESMELARTVILRLDRATAGQEIQRILSELENQAYKTTGRTWAADEVTFRFSVGMRYVGQAHELELDVEDRAIEPSALVSRYSDAYEQTYGYREENPVEMVSWYCTIVRRRSREDEIREGQSVSQGNEMESALKGQREAYYGDRAYIQVPVFDRYKLVPGTRLEGPGLIEERHTTIVLQPGDVASLDPRLNLIVDVN